MDYPSGYDSRILRYRRASPDITRELDLGYRGWVWYDEFSLKVADSLRASIERGLRETRKCIMVLSPYFLSNEGWGRAEFDSVYTREILEKKNVILPVWLNVEAKDVYNYSSRLADKVGLAATLGAPEVARLLANAIKAGD